MRMLQWPLVLLLSVAAVPGFANQNPASTKGSGPPKAVTVSNIQSAYSWSMTSDAGTGGAATGTMNLVSSPSLSGVARDFGISYQNGGGERYWATFGKDTAATNFTYDARVYIAGPSSGIANLEFDTNQVMSNGQTVIYAVQCDGYSGTWDVTTNAGSPQNYVDEWLNTSAPCNPRTWATNTWHHVQMSYSRDSLGNVNYKSVTLDGVAYKINMTVPSAFALGWAQVLLTNFQIDGLGASGSATVYVDQLAISRW